MRESATLRCGRNSAADRMDGSADDCTFVGVDVATTESRTGSLRGWRTCGGGGCAGVHTLVQGSAVQRSVSLDPRDGVLRETVGHFLAAFICLTFLSPPGLVVWFARVRVIPGRTLAGMAALERVALTVSMFIAWHYVLKRMVAWTADVIMRMGIFDYANAWSVGVSPMTLILQSAWPFRRWCSRC